MAGNRGEDAGRWAPRNKKWKVPPWQRTFHFAISCTFNPLKAGCPGSAASFGGLSWLFSSTPGRDNRVFGWQTIPTTTFSIWPFFFAAWQFSSLLSFWLSSSWLFSWLLSSWLLSSWLPSSWPSSSWLPSSWLLSWSPSSSSPSLPWPCGCHLPSVKRPCFQRANDLLIYYGHFFGFVKNKILFYCKKVLSAWLRKPKRAFDGNQWSRRFRSSRKIETIILTLPRCYEVANGSNATAIAVIIGKRAQQT